MTIVYKLGGSLLSLPDLPERLRVVLSDSADTRALLVIGGGVAADIVRSWDEVHHLGEERSHWLALRAMYFNEALLLELLPDACSVVDQQEADAAWKAGRVAVLRAVEFLKQEQARHGASLRQNWNVTSDSVTGWVAEHLREVGMVLLKSVAVPNENGSPTLTAESPQVDPYFQRLAKELPSVGWINLRETRPRLERVSLT